MIAGVSILERLNGPRPERWPAFSSPVRSTALTARIGRVLGICFGICLVTGCSATTSSALGVAARALRPRGSTGSHRGYTSRRDRVIPLLLVKLWSVFPNLFRWPAVRSLKHAAERLSVFVLISTALVQLTTGDLDTLNWYPWPWDFVSVHRFLAYVLIG